MPEPRRTVLKRFGEGLHHPNPDQVTFQQLSSHIDSLPEDGWVSKEEIRQQLTYELDGARPVT